MLKLPLVGEALPTSTRGLRGEFSMQASSLSSWLFTIALSYYFIIDYFNFHCHLHKQGNVINADSAFAFLMILVIISQNSQCGRVGQVCQGDQGG